MYYIYIIHGEKMLSGPPHSSGPWGACLFRLIVNPYSKSPGYDKRVNNEINLYNQWFLLRRHCLLKIEKYFRIVRISTILLLTLLTLLIVITICNVTFVNCAVSLCDIYVTTSAQSRSRQMIVKRRSTGTRLIGGNSSYRIVGIGSLVVCHVIR